MSRWTDQMYDNTLDIVRGPQDMHRLDYSCALKSGEEYSQGMIVSVDSDEGTMIQGCPAGSVGNRPMPMFAIQGTDDLDVVNDGYNVGRGYVSAVVATGGFEVRTSAFVVKDAESDYKVNDLLTPGTLTNIGLADKAEADAYGEVPIVGIVSQRGATAAANQSEYKTNVLYFWTVFYPATPATAASSS